jgi:hypothetical protein
MLGHALGGIAGIYQRHRYDADIRYDAEIRAAFVAWADWIDGLIKP